MSNSDRFDPPTQEELDKCIAVLILVGPDPTMAAVNMAVDYDGKQFDDYVLRYIHARKIARLDPHDWPFRRWASLIDDLKLKAPQLSNGAPDEETR